MTGTMRVAIQADDLTGACDTGAVFAAQGLETVVLLEDAPGPVPTPAVVVIDTESRSRPPLEARSRARAAAERLAESRPAVLYKKVDSTLRGALAAEVAGVLEGAGLASVVLAPAFPAQRRTVADGMLHVDGRRADEGPAVRDPGFPATGGASVVALIAAAGPHPVAHLPLATVRRGADAVAMRLARPVTALVCDAETDADLAVLAAAALGGPALLAGSAGLATAIAARLGTRAHLRTRRPRRPLLIVAGSPHPTTQGQIERLEARGVWGTRIDGDDDELAAGRPLDGGDVILAARAEPDGTRAERETMAGRLAETACRFLVGPARRTSDGGFGALLLTGGDTAFAVCRALAATGITLGGEMEPGLPHGVLLDGPYAGLPVITKAGGFGDVDTLVRIWEACA